MIIYTYIYIYAYTYIYRALLQRGTSNTLVFDALEEFIVWDIHILGPLADFQVSFVDF